MEGFVLAAGLGTRLRPLTNDRPKALVEIPVRWKDERGKSGMREVALLEVVIRRLEEAGVEHIVVNVHHFADKVIAFIGSRRWKAMIDISDERDLLLDTGGGLKYAAPLFSGRENILVHNVDILSDIDFADVERRHNSDGNLVTLCVSRRETKRLLEFDNGGCLVGRADKGMAFSGVSMVSPALFPLLPEANHPYPIIDEYIRLAHSAYRIGCYEHKADRWLDVGKPETLEQARQWKLS